MHLRGRNEVNVEWHKFDHRRRPFVTGQKSGEVRTDGETVDNFYDEQSTDSRKPRHLRKLFDLFDVDGSGYVDAAEIRNALKGGFNYQVRVIRY